MLRSWPSPYELYLQHRFNIQKNPDHPPNDSNVMLKSSCPKMSLSPIKSKHSNTCKVQLDIHTYILRKGHLLTHKQYAQMVQHPCSPKIWRKDTLMPPLIHIFIELHICPSGYKFFNPHDTMNANWPYSRQWSILAPLPAFTDICLMKESLLEHEIIFKTQVCLIWHKLPHNAQICLLWHKSASYGI